MFIPIFIAILLGLVNPANSNSNCSNHSGTVVTTQGDPGDGSGDDGPGTGTGTGGGAGQNPPPPPSHP
jgi:hypothetical protein